MITSGTRPEAPPSRPVALTTTAILSIAIHGMALASIWLVNTLNTPPQVNTGNELVFTLAFEAPTPPGDPTVATADPPAPQAAMAETAMVEKATPELTTTEESTAEVPPPPEPVIETPPPEPTTAEPAPEPVPEPEPVKEVVTAEPPPPAPVIKPPPPVVQRATAPASPPQPATTVKHATRRANTHPAPTAAASRGDGGIVAQAPVAARALSQPKPRYPLSARRRGLEGRVVLKVRVNAAGTVAAIEVASSSGAPPLDAAALEAVRSWTFTPAKRMGVAVEDVVEVPVRFQLNEG